MPSRFTNKKVSGVNVKQTVFLIINGVNIISYAYIYSCLSYTQRKDSSNNHLHLLLTKLIIV